jgi:prevent-host-death family protein
VLNIDQAKTHLSRLIEEVMEGGTVVVAKAGKPMVQLVPVAAAGTARSAFLPVRPKSPPIAGLPIKKWSSGFTARRRSGRHGLRSKWARLLLESHALLRALTAPERLSAIAAHEVSSAANTV